MNWLEKVPGEPPPQKAQPCPPKTCTLLHKQKNNNNHPHWIRLAKLTGPHSHPSLPCLVSKEGPE